MFYAKKSTNFSFLRRFPKVVVLSTFTFFLNHHNAKETVVISVVEGEAAAPEWNHVVICCGRRSSCFRRKHCGNLCCGRKSCSGRKQRGICVVKGGAAAPERKQCGICVVQGGAAAPEGNNVVSVCGRRSCCSWGKQCCNLCCGREEQLLSN